MVIVVEKYTDNINKLQETIRCLNLDIRIVILKDDGFLPTGMLSPYEYYLYQENQKIYEKKELFYDFLKIPEFWEIRTDGLNGAIYDMGCKKASIYFVKPIEKRNVQRVEWHLENGWVYKIDYYNKYALKYASEFLDKEGKVESKVYYTEKNQEIIVEQPQNDTITLLHDGKVRAYFTSYSQFIGYFLEMVGQHGKAVFLMQDKDQNELLDCEWNGRSLWKYVLFRTEEMLDEYKSMGGENGYRFYTIPEKYPENYARGEALILTASDQIEGIEYLTDELAFVKFHIAANTQVSDKLNSLAEKSNVEVYPQISTWDLNRLWEKCDFYLDINYYREIHNAIDTAHQKNLLIMGFSNTLHGRELMVDEYIFDQADREKLVLAVKKLTDNPGLMMEMLEKQQGKKRKVWNKLQELAEV